MRTLFLLALLAASLFYTYVAFSDLSFLSRTGRLGPGFFPRLLGIGLVVTCAASLAIDLRRERAGGFRSDYWPELGLVVALSGLLVLSLNLFGGTLASALFLLVTLSFLNRGRHLTNLAVAVLVPAAIYVLFKLILNASMPRGSLFFAF